MLWVYTFIHYGNGAAYDQERGSSFLCAVHRAKRQQKSRHKTDQLCLRFFWKVMLVGYVTAESQNVQPRRV